MALFVKLELLNTPTTQIIHALLATIVKIRYLMLASLVPITQSLVLLIHRSV